MTPSPQPKLLTAEEFARLPESKDGSRQELVRGVVQTTLLPKFRHGKAQAKIARLIGNFCDATRLVMS